MTVLFSLPVPVTTGTFVGLQVADGWTVVQDNAYCGFDDGSRFWSRVVYAKGPAGDTEFAYGPDLDVVARLPRGIQSYDGDHVLLTLAKKIARRGKE